MNLAAQNFTFILYSLVQSQHISTGCVSGQLLAERQRLKIDKDPWSILGENETPPFFTSHFSNYHEADLEPPSHEFQSKSLFGPDVAFCSQEGRTGNCWSPLKAHHWRSESLQILSLLWLLLLILSDSQLRL